VSTGIADRDHVRPAAMERDGRTAEVRGSIARASPPGERARASAEWLCAEVVGCRNRQPSQIAVRAQQRRVLALECAARR
jgi:hypothetical protein